MLLKRDDSSRKAVISSKEGNVVVVTSDGSASTTNGGGGSRGTGMRMTMATSFTMTSRIHRKGFRIPSKKHPGKALPGKLHSISRIGPGKIQPGKRLPQRPHPPPCDNSNDSGFGFDQHVELQQTTAPHQQLMRSVPTSRSTATTSIYDGERDELFTDDSSDFHSAATENASNRIQIRPKRRRIESVVDDNDDACSEDAFIQKITSSSTSSHTSAGAMGNGRYEATVAKMITNPRGNARMGSKRQPAQAQNNVTTSSNGRVQLEIVSQPEQQHRARYQTEGSRGAVKDRSGNGFPIVKLVGYDKPAVLQVFIGTDIGRVAPHMFYQACKVSGKNSTPCNETKVDGTMIIEIDFKPESDMIITCDCVGILKERNVDVEHRFPDHSAQKNKKKSTRCRMVFRTQLTHEDGSVETIQICSNPIICTQPPGVPEICKKSLTSSPVNGGLEMFVIGKNFLKDTCVVFKEDVPQASSSDMVPLGSIWEQTVMPDKEYLQQTHLVCVVPPYIHQNIMKPVTVEFYIMSSGKKSESHLFMYTPKGSHTILSAATTLSTPHGTINGQDAQYMDNGQGCSPTGNPSMGQLWAAAANAIEPKHELDSGMMPPPATTTIPVGVRRPSATSSMLTDQIAQITGLKTEIIDESSSHSMSETMQTDAFPVAPNDNTMVGYHPKQSIDLMDMSSMAMVCDTNSMSGFPNHHQVHLNAAAVEMAVKNEQIAMLNAAASVVQGQATVDKFLSSLDANMPGVASPVNPFSNSNQATSIDQTLTNMLANNSGSSVPISQILNIPPPQSQPQNDASSILSRSPSSSNSSSSPSPNGGFESPITHDIILNSNTAANLLMASPPNTSPPTERITTDIIMNPAVPPTILTDPTNLVVASQVAIANGLLNEISSLSPQTSQDAHPILNNIIMASPTNSPPQQQQQQPQPLSPVQQAAVAQAANTASTAVSNMMLKVAADFITNQEKNQLTTESTINALMSLNTSPIQTQAQVSQILNSSAMPATESICPQQSQFLASHQHHQIMNNRPQEAATLTNTSLVSMLLSHNVTTAEAASNAATTTTANVGQNDFIHSNSAPMTLGVTPLTNQESLMQSAMAVPSNAAVQQIAANTGLTQTTQPPPTTTTIPDQLTTMSDQDLISYINPSAFDQV